MATSLSVTPAFDRVRLPVAWVMVGAIVGVTAAMSQAIGLTVMDWRAKAATVSVLAAIAVCGGQWRSGIVGQIVECLASWIAFCAAAGVFIYCAATVAAPTNDHLVRQIDAWLGFDWLNWYNAVQARPWLNWTLATLYGSLGTQILLVCFYLPLAGLTRQARELITLAAAALLLTSAVFAIAPVLGPFATYRPNEPDLTDLLVLRSPGPWVISIRNIHGIVAMPSFHTTLAVLFFYGFRRTAIWPVVTLVNLAMLPAIPPIGGHYVADMLAGAVIAAVCIATSRIAPKHGRGAPAAPTTATL